MTQKTEEFSSTAAEAYDPEPLYLPGKKRWYPLSGWLHAPQFLSGRRKAQRKFLPMMGIENRLLGFPDLAPRHSTD
jgi:hypothetical protein